MDAIRGSVVMRRPVPALLLLAVLHGFVGGPVRGQSSGSTSKTNDSTARVRENPSRSARQHDRAVSRALTRMRRAAGDRVRTIRLGEQALALLAEGPDPVAEAEVRSRLGEALLNEQRYPEAMEHLEHGCALARRNGEDNLVLQCLGNIALISHLTGDLDRTLATGEECLALAEKVDQRVSIWRIRSILAATLERRGEYREALQHYSRAFEIAVELEDPDGMSSLLNNLSVIHMNLGEYEESIRFLERAQEILQAQGDQHGIATALSNRGELYLLMGDHDRALDCHQEALRIQKKGGTESGAAQAHRSLGAVYHAMEQYDLALEHFGKALAIQRRLGIQPEVISTLANLAETYAALDRSSEALELAREGLAMAEAGRLKTYRRDVLSSLSRAHEAAGDHEKALEVLKEASRLDGEIRSLESIRDFAAFQARYDYREKERQIDMLRKDNRLQALEVGHERLLRNSVLIGGLLVLAAGVIGWNLFLAKRRAHRQLSMAHLRLRETNREMLARSAALEQAMAKIQRLEGLLPICSHCKSIRDDEGTWQPLESYLSVHGEVDFSHSVCPRCLEAHYPEPRPIPLDPGKS